MTTLSGLVYVKHVLVGTDSEGPAYYLQTAHGDFVLDCEQRVQWEPDYHLEYYCRRMVEVSGNLHDDNRLHVEQIKALNVDQIP